MPTPEQFATLLAQSNISLEKKKDILANLKYYSESEIEYLYNVLNENVQKQKKILADFRIKTQMIDLEYEIKIKKEIKKLKDLDKEWRLPRDIEIDEMEEKKRRDAIFWNTQTLNIKS